jgi:hypothetical protein
MDDKIVKATAHDDVEIDIKVTGKRKVGESIVVTVRIGEAIRIGSIDDETLEEGCGEDNPYK